MKRRLLNFLTALSLLMCVALVALWGWGVGRQAEFRWEREWEEVDRHGYRAHIILCRSGRIGWGMLWNSWPPSPYTQLEQQPIERPVHRFRWRIRDPSRKAGIEAWTWGYRHTGTRDSQDYQLAGLRAQWGGHHAIGWSFALWLPDWLLILIFSVLPFHRARVYVRHYREAAGGLCRRCGYDLRATPGRCPECGAGREIGTTG
jgi:hypothetical protein